MALDYWASYYTQARIAGKGDLIEDDDFDLNRILAEQDEKAEAAAIENGEWDDVGSWELKPESER